MKIKSNFSLVDIAGEYMAIPVGEEATSFNGLVALTEAASFLLKNMNEPKTKEDLVALLIQEYDVEKVVAEEDVSKMVKDLLNMGVIEE